MFANFIATFKKDLAAGESWALYIGAVGKAALHGGWASLSAGIAAGVLDSSKFNVTNGLKSEFNLLAMTFISSGALAAYSYVKANKPPTV
jgi:hypothetical protein